MLLKIPQFGSVVLFMLIWIRLGWSWQVQSIIHGHLTSQLQSAWLILAFNCDKWDGLLPLTNEMNWQIFLSPYRLALAQSHGINRSPINWVIMSRLNSELTQSHFYHDLLVNEDHKANPYSHGEEIYTVVDGKVGI